MPRKFDKKNAKTFNIVHRAHDDVKFYDDDAAQNVLVEQQNQKPSTSKNKKIYSTNDLEARLKNKVRENEGLAAQYGITYDDSNYDYMQHLKPIGDDNEGVFIKAKDETSQPKKQLNLEELLRDNLPSEEKRYVARDLNQSIPDELKGFNPNMDPRLREVLEALEDEAYIEDTQKETGDEEEGDVEDDDMFADLLKSGEIQDDEYDDYYDDEYNDEDYDEWDMDNYEDEYNERYDEQPEELAGNKEINENWQKDFVKFKKDSKNKTNEWDSDDEFEEEDEPGEEEEEEEHDNLGELPNLENKSKKSKTKLRKKKGAMTDTSSFSMSSSALFRTEGLSILDDKYDQLNKNYTAKDITTTQKPFNMSEERTDFENLLDDFLDNYELESGGRKLVKKDDEKLKLQKAAKSVSKGKNGDLNKSFQNLKLDK
ncbi:LTV1 [Candida jiufengensis]|uniref:LTV1 n=1 Tax=Candida jiufengensis TaxID=497108 RepID=UPI0022253E31|nr:LTV1 [Candida jiufengensis]KAI5957240.1 LTV1 [Candida jiufengensis]